MRRIHNYVLERADEDRTRNGEIYYKIKRIDLLICNKENPIGSYNSPVVKVWISDPHKKFYSLLKIRDNYQKNHSIEFKGRKVYFDLDFKEL